MSAIDFAARLAGVPQDTIDEVEDAAPALAELLNLFKQNQDVIARAGAIYQEAKPLLDKVSALAPKVYADLVKITPAAQKLVAFVKAESAISTDQSSGDTGAHGSNVGNG